MTRLVVCFVAKSNTLICHVVVIPKRVSEFFERLVSQTVRGTQNSRVIHKRDKNTSWGEEDRAISSPITHRKWPCRIPRGPLVPLQRDTFSVVFQANCAYDSSQRSANGDGWKGRGKAPVQREDGERVLDTFQPHVTVTHFGRNPALFD